MALKVSVIALTGIAFLGVSNASAWDQYPFDDYLQRKDTVTLDAGNAKAANTVTHMINPWPPYVMDRRIRGNGQRMVGAVERYQDVGRIPRVPCPIAPQFDVQTNGIRSATATTQCGQARPVAGTQTTGTTTNGAGGQTTSSSVTMPFFAE